MISSVNAEKGFDKTEDPFRIFRQIRTVGTFLFNLVKNMCKTPKVNIVLKVERL